MTAVFVSVGMFSDFCYDAEALREDAHAVEREMSPYGAPRTLFKGDCPKFRTRVKY